MSQRPGSETAQIMGKENAVRMIGKEGWIVPAREAYEIGLVHSVVPPAQLMNASFELAREWIKTGKPRQIGPLKGGAGTALTLTHNSL
jgi:enoyl-CoA hydratase/carnithine racemase